MVRNRIAWLTAVLLVVSLFMAGPVMAQDPLGRVNINTASVDDLAQLNRVGLKLAERIVEYRDQNGPFEKPEDLMQVKGIGPMVFDLNKDVIVVADNG